MSNQQFIEYEDAYNEAILDFISDQIDKKPFLNSFFQSFYQTCLNMLDNGIDLSNKQREIIEREMIKQKISIPQLKNFGLKFSIPLHFHLQNRIYNAFTNLDDFFLALSKIEIFNKAYEKAFEENTHFVFHKISREKL